MNSTPKSIHPILESYSNCNLCPHACAINRNAGQKGFCGCTSDLLIASVCAHQGEEPAISGKNGICNVFFGRCNLACKYCQNHQISKRSGTIAAQICSVDELIKHIIAFLEKGCHAVGFVSPSHYTPHVRIIVESLREHGFNPVFVYNTNCYDSPSVLASLEDCIDVYLPDFKYSDNNLAYSLSGILNYRETAMAALKEMYRQKGSTLRLDEDGYAENGLIVRHLVLPGFVENSLEVLEILADISMSLSISLMSQYHPSLPVKNYPSLASTITKEEYETVVAKFETLGFYKGWLQEFESSNTYLPDFHKSLPFS